MMSMRTLGILAGLTILVVIAAVVSSERGSYTPVTDKHELLFPNLNHHLNDVAEIEITGPDQSITLSKKGDGWVDKSRGGYAVRFEPVKALLLTLRDAEVLDRKTSDPANYERLGVADPSAEGASSVLLTLRDAAGQTLASAVLGKVREIGDARFVRRDAEDEVLLVEGRLNVNPRATAWLDRQVMRLPRDKVERVTVVRPSGQEFTVRRNPENRQQFELAEMPEGREVNAPSLLARVAYALSYADFDDVIPESSVDFERLLPPLLATYETTDAMEIDVSVWRRDNEKWVSLKAGAAADKEVSDETATTIKDLNARFAGWLFKLSPTVTLAWDSTLDQLTKPIPTPPPPPPAGPQAPSQAPQPGGEGG